MAVLQLEHPLAGDRLALLRDERTDRPAFRRALEDLTGFLVYEATRGVPFQQGSVRTPLGDAATLRPAVDPLLVPIIRAGLGMLPSALSLFPGAETAFLGLQKGPPGGEPSIYFNTLPSSLDQRPALVLEPMIASGGSAAKACDLLHIAGAGQVSVVTVLATPDGIARVLQTPAQPHIVTAAIDPELDHIAFIVPGLGDAGDRQFGDM